MLIPFERETLEQIVKLEGLRLSTFEDGFDDGWREQGEAQDSAEIGFVDGFCFGKVTDGGKASGLQYVAPAVGTDESL